VNPAFRGQQYRDAFSDHYAQATHGSGRHGMRSSWWEEGQPSHGPATVTVVVRSIPYLTLRYGTRVARRPVKWGMLLVLLATTELS
jgi:hypothetical protein